MRHREGRLRAWTVWRVAFLLVPIGLAVSGAQQPPTPQPTFRTDASYVRVDVYPTRDGLPVADLRKEDFEVLEDKAAQTIDQFEHIVIRSAGAQDARREPNTVAESRQAAQDPRARVFVLFLDINHVELAASRAIRTPLIEALDRLIGADDLIAVMTPEMSPADITFARRTTTIEGLLTRHWWGERDRAIFKDPIDDQYARCYPGIPRPGEATASDQGIAQEMILRRREKQTLDSLADLVQFLGGVREERKAVITITDGWRLYGPNAALVRPIDSGTPPIPTVGIDPRTGSLTGRRTDPGRANPNDCDRDRLALSQLDDEQQFREILDEANRANASFYPIDPRGLAVFDENIVPAAGVGAGINANPTVSPVDDRARLTARNASLRTLAEATDGIAVVDSNDLARGLRRIVDDLSSYYLLGYYSAGKLDGKFHSISVRVKRPGIQVRARRGYLANTAAAAAALTKVAAPPSPAAATAAAVGTAIGSLSTFARELPVRLHAAAGWGPSGAATVWAVAEVGRGAGNEDWAEGGQVDAMLVDAAGTTVATGRTQIARGSSTVRLALTANALGAGNYQLRIRAKGARAAGAANEMMEIALPASPHSTSAVFIRRGATTGNRDVPTADLRFRRSDRLRVEVPTPSADAVAARLLDRNGSPLALPVAGAIRDDPDGSRWQSAELSLAPLAPGDYVVELATAGGRTLAAFRVIP